MQGNCEYVVRFHQNCSNYSHLESVSIRPWGGTFYIVGSVLEEIWVED